MYSLFLRLCRRCILFPVISGFIIFISGAAKAEDFKIIMKGWILHPENFTVNIHAGDTLIWVNDDDAQHTITFEDPTVKSSENLSPGRQFSLQFDAAGEYSYYCKYHAVLGMKGIVRVTAK